MEPTTSNRLATVEAGSFVAGIVVAFIFPPASFVLFAITWVCWRKRRRAERRAARLAAHG